MDSLNLKSKKLIQFKNIQAYRPSYPIKIWGKLVKGILSYDQASKQQNLLYPKHLMCVVER